MIDRRDLLKFFSGAAAAGFVEPLWLAHAFPRTDRLSWRAYRTAGAEGVWKLEEVEGEVPDDLSGTLYRTAPGQSENHGVKLKHLFDGDAFLSGYSFREGAVTLRAGFLQTPQRRRELEAGKMLYAEFGTLPPDGGGRGGKNQASVNVIPWGEGLLGLSEGGPPTAIDPRDLSFRGEWDCGGKLPRNIGFTAHPRVDPETGACYAFGTLQGMELALLVCRMEPDGGLTELHRLRRRHYHMIHDMLLTENWFVLVVPPISFDISVLLTGRGSPGDALKFAEHTPTRILVLRKDGGGHPVEIELPPCTVFHHGNAFEKDGQVVLDTFPSPDGSLLESLHMWAEEEIPDFADTVLTRFELDLEEEEAVKVTEYGTNHEFPRYDMRGTGSELRWLYTLQATSADDPFAFTRLVRTDLETGKAEAVDSGAKRVFGEAVFVPRDGSDGEGDGWLLHMGYDGDRDRTFLDVRDAGTLERVARAWTPSHFPLGFHGNFQPDWYVKGS